MNPATLRARIASGDAPSLPELARELVNARASGADYATISYVIDLFRAAGGAESLTDEQIETWLDESLPILANRETSQALDVWREFAICLLVDPADGVAQYCDSGSEQLAAVELVASLFRREVNGEDASDDDWRAAENKATRAAAWARTTAAAAWAAAAAAARAAGGARAAAAVGAWAWAAAGARAAAWAAWAAAAAAAARAAGAAAARAAREAQAIKLAALLMGETESAQCP